MRLRTLEKPTIAAVHGWCLGGACELAMACDLVVATEDARFGEPEIRFGSGPVTLLMPFVLGEKKTNELLLTGDTIDADEAERRGLVNRVVPASRLEAAVAELVRQDRADAAAGASPDKARARQGGRGERPARGGERESRPLGDPELDRDAGRPRVRANRRRARAEGRARVARRPLRRATMSVLTADANAGRVALVTGGGTGIGRATALELARTGARLVICGRRPEPLEAAKAEVEALGSECLAVPTDVREPEQVDALLDAALGRFGANRRPRQQRRRPVHREAPRTSRRTAGAPCTG